MNDEKKFEELEEAENTATIGNEELKEGIEAGTTDVEISTKVKENFLDYAMSVIVARALPDVRDGLKPVHRRVIFGMNEAGMTPGKPFKKCARIVGDVMGKYHPHGDQSIYSTLVRLAQPFAMRYTLVDGQGNFGSVDGDEAAAMRYTEARMEKIAAEMVRDIDENTVDFVANYDGNEQEPSVLPSRIPNLLINGSSGIAVGMATNIPPHNLTETVNAVIAVAKNPDITSVEIMTNYLTGPDFPTSAMICGRGGIRQAYETGRGSIIIQSKCEIKELANGKSQIIVTELPYQVNKARLVEKIADLVKNKVVEGITDIRDESNDNKIRVVIDVRKDIIPHVLLNQLYKNTPLRTPYSINMLCLVNGAPKTLPIKDMLVHYLAHQIDVVTRRTQFRLKKDLDRDHIVVGLLICQDNLDRVIQIIRGSDTPEIAAETLTTEFGLSELQTSAILALNLRRLAKSEKQKFIDERILLEKNIAYYNELLGSREKLTNLVVDELEEVKEKYGDERKTIISDDYNDIDDEDIIPEEEIIITLTNGGYVKRVPSDTFRTQNRGGVGVRGMKTNADDVVSVLVHAKTHTDILFFSSLGRIYRSRGHQIYSGTRDSKGHPIQNLLNLEKDEKIVALIAVDEYGEDQYLFFTTSKGIVKRTCIQEFARINSNGKIAIGLNDDDQLLSVKKTDGTAFVGLAASNGKLAKFHENDVRVMGRSAHGVRGMNVGTKDAVIDVVTSLEGDSILSLSEKGIGKISSFESYRLTKRGASGVFTMKITEKTGNIVGVRAVNKDNDLMVITNQGTIIRTSLENFREAGRNTSGVIIMRPREKEIISSLALVPHADEESESGEEAASE